MGSVDLIAFPEAGTRNALVAGVPYRWLSMPEAEIYLIHVNG